MPPVNSEQRRAARRKRREEKRAKAKAERVKACTLETVADLNSLCKASKQAARGVMWKSSTQRYMRSYLRNAVLSRRDLLEGRDICRGFIRFDLWERGKLRHISAVHFPERVVQKSLSQNALVPAIVPTLIAANSANIKGRGTDYALKLLKRHLADHWRRHGGEGYILLGDFSDYFARIAHQPVKDQVASALLDPRVVALEHRLIDAQGDVGLGLGSEPNQICAVAHPNRIDHYVAEMLRPESYGRYMDDFYLIHESKEYLQVCLLLIEHVREARHRAEPAQDPRGEADTRLHVAEEAHLLHGDGPHRHEAVPRLHHARAPQAEEDGPHGGRGGHDARAGAAELPELARRHGSLGRAPQRAGHGRAVPQPVRKSRGGGLLNATKPERRFGRNALAIAEGRQLKTAA